MFIRVFKESFAQALQQLIANKLRSFLSLLGVTIGIFCIIAVKSAVNSLEDNIRNSFKRIGDDILYISKMPWNEDPQENYWKYQRRPNPSFTDYKILTERLNSAQAVSFYLIAGARTIKYEGNSVENTFAIAPTMEFGEVHNMEFETGRYFSQIEYNSGAPKILIGAKVADELFGTIDPLGREVKYFGQKMQVIGVIKRAGKSLIQPFNFDNAVLFTYEFARSVINVKPQTPWGTSLEIKAKNNVSLLQLRDEVIGTLRAARQLRPSEKDDFSINELSILLSATESFFAVLNSLGYVIGGFALLVGMFSVANIMFVSVKERTSIIGIKKALGAKRSVILTEFLIEAIILCLLGGIIGLIFVWSILKIVSIFSAFEMYVSLSNMINTVLLSVIVGVIAGFIPAAQAASLDPVEAMRA